ncbi:MAG: PilZ domain-containing protein [Pseudomonadota bacterium]
MSAALAKPANDQLNGRAKPDRRRHYRVSLKLNGRFLHEGADHTFLTQNISCGGAAVEAAAVPGIGTRVVCYFDDLGRVSGEVTRVTDDGFAVAFQTPQHKKDKLADRLIWLLNHKKYELKDERSSPRKDTVGPALITRENGTKLQCRVIDISLSGAAFEFDGPVPIVGEKIRVGSLHGEVVRAVSGEFAIRFLHNKKSPAPRS